MSIGIIGAMEEEIQVLRRMMEQQEQCDIDAVTLFSGKIAGKDVVLLQSGIGKVNAAMTTTLLYKEFTCDYIINIGSAGGLLADMEVGDIVISSSLCYYDVDVTAFGYKFGQVPRMPHTYTPDPMLVELAKKSARKITAQRVYTGLIISGDSFINSTTKTMAIKEKFPSAYAVDMESCAIAQVCHVFNIPFVIVRSISDTANHDSHIDSEKFLALAANNATQLVAKMIGSLKIRSKEYD